MALIKCPDCGKMISSRALKCPDCGCPVEKPKRHNRICPECGQLVDMSDVATEKCENCGCPIAMFDKLQYKKNSELLNILDSLIVHKQGKLLKCPDCGKMISIRALQCPNCGCPHSMFVDNHNTIKDNATNVSTMQYTNTDEDFPALEREAKNGNTESMVRLASAYESRKGVSPLKAFLGVISSLIIVVLWWNSCNSQDNEFFQKGYIYTAQETRYNVFNSPISYTYTLTLYNDGSITLNEKTSDTDITYDCTLTKHCESERDIRVTWFELEGKRYSRATTLYFDVHGNCYHPMGRSGHDAIASGKYDFTLSKRKLN